MMSRPGLAVAAVLLTTMTSRATDFRPVTCEGAYSNHLQGVCTDGKGTIYWSFTTKLVKTDAGGKVIGTARSDFDGFFLFERVAFGRYTFRLADESAKAADVSRVIDATAEITPERTVIRLGAIRIQKRAQLALANGGNAMTGSPR